MSPSSLPFSSFCISHFSLVHHHLTQAWEIMYNLMSCTTKCSPHLNSSNLSRSESEKLLTAVGKDEKKPHKKENKLHALGKRARYHQCKHAMNVQQYMYCVFSPFLSLVDYILVTQISKFDLKLPCICSLLGSLPTIHSASLMSL